MTLTIELPPDKEAELHRAAERCGQTPAEFAAQALLQALQGEEGEQQEDSLITLLDEWDAEDAARTGEPVPLPTFSRFTATWRRAAALWATSRQAAIPTAADAVLDGNLLLAALAEREGGIVATDNVRHLGRFVPARPWREIEW